MGSNRKRPFGYRMEFGEVVLHQAEAETVRWIYDSYLAGASYNALVDKLRERGVPYDGDKPWNKNMTARILADHRYTGGAEFPQIIPEGQFNMAQVRRQERAAPCKKTPAQKELRKLCGGSQPAWVEPPFIPGHEFLGHIVEKGANVTEFQLGDRITADQIVPCGSCRFCRSGRYWMCQPHAIFGFQHGNNGGMAEYVRYPKTAVISRVPEDMPLEKALLIEPYGCSKHAVDRAQIQSEDVVVISGAGTLGLGMITYARRKNPALLIALDMLDNRLEKAKEFGADLALNPGKEDVQAKIMELTEGYGCDIYIEATGHPSSVLQGLGELPAVMVTLPTVTEESSP